MIRSVGKLTERDFTPASLAINIIHIQIAVWDISKCPESQSQNWLLALLLSLRIKFKADRLVNVVKL